MYYYHVYRNRVAPRFLRTTPTLGNTLSRALLFHDVLPYFEDKHLTNLLLILDLYFTQHPQ